MAWARLDDQRATNAKLMAAGLEARGLDEAAICWAVGNHTDGHLPTQAVAMLAAGHGCTSWKRVVARLVKAGRWVANGDGWDIHDFLEYNPAASLYEKKAAAGRRGAAARWGSKPMADANDTPMADANGKTPIVPMAVPTRPVSNSSSSTPPLGLSAEEEDEDDRNDGEARQRALAEVAAWQADQSTSPIVNRNAWLRTAIANLDAGHPDATPQEILALISTGNRRPEDTTLAAQQRTYELARQRREHPCPECGGDMRVETQPGIYADCPTCHATGIAPQEAAR